MLVLPQEGRHKPRSQILLDDQLTAFHHTGAGITGGKGAFTQQAHGEFIVRPEKKCPPNTQQAHGEYFLKVLTQVPGRYFVKGTFEFFDNSPPTVPTRHFVKEPPESIHNSLLKVPWEYFVKVTLDLFHNSHPNVPTGHFVKETLDSIHNLLYNVPIKNLSHPSRVLSNSVYQCDYNVLNQVLSGFIESLW